MGNDKGGGGGTDLGRLAMPSYQTVLERLLGIRNQSSPTLGPQLSVVADMRQGELNLKPEDAAGTATPVGIPRCCSIED